MKKIYFIIVILFLTCNMSFSQTCIPDTLCFTGVARYANNNPVADTTIDVQIQVFQGNNSSNPLYCELQLNITTNSFGEFSACFGAPTYLCSPFDSLGQVLWQTCDLHYSLNWRITGQTSLVPIVTSRFGTVPYAFASRTAESISSFDLSNAQNGNVLVYDATTQKWIPGTGGTTGTISAGNGISVQTTGSNTTITNTAPSGDPSGTIVAYGGTTVPAGWLMCDGSPELRTGTTANLFAAIGISWGAGDGVNTFNLPDMRGMFLRGVDKSNTGVVSGNDPNSASRTAVNGGNAGDYVGSVEQDAFQGHRHGFIGGNGTSSAGSGGAWWISNVYNDVSPNTIRNDVTGAADAITDGTNGTPRITSETRPINVYVYYIIKE